MKTLLYVPEGTATVLSKQVRDSSRSLLSLCPGAELVVAPGTDGGFSESQIFRLLEIVQANYIKMAKPA